MALILGYSESIGSTNWYIHYLLKRGGTLGYEMACLTLRW